MTTLAAHPDQSLVDRLGASDPEAVREVYRRILPGIVAYVRRNSGTEEEARDLFQDALVVVFRKAKEGGFELTASLSTYLHAVCRNLWLKRLRRRGREEVTLDTDAVYPSDESLEKDLDREERYAVYREHFDRLSGDCRKVLGMFFAGRPMSDIATAMGYGSEAYAKKRKFQCKEKLVESVRDDPRYAELKR